MESNIEDQLKINRNPSVYLPSSKVVRNSILLSGDVSYPIVGIDVVDTEEVKAVNAKPDILENRVVTTVVIVQQPVAHTDVGTLIGWCTEGVVFQLCLGRSQ